MFHRLNLTFHPHPYLIAFEVGNSLFINGQVQRLLFVLISQKLEYYNIPNVNFFRFSIYFEGIVANGDSLRWYITFDIEG